VWLGGLRLAVLFLLAQATAQAGANTGLLLSWVGVDRSLSAVVVVGFGLATLLAAGGLLAVAGGRHALALVLTIGALTAEQTAALADLGGTSSLFRLGEIYFWPLPLAVAFALPLVRSRPSASRPWPWLLAVPAALFLLPTQFDATLRSSQPWAFGAVLLACLLWTVIDARVPIGAAGLALAFATFLLDSLLTMTAPSLFWYWLIGTLTLAVGLLGAGALLGVRQPERKNSS
jgi:hypothetical protein